MRRRRGVVWGSMVAAPVVAFFGQWTGWRGMAGANVAHAASAIAAEVDAMMGSDTNSYDYNPAGKRDPFRPLSLVVRALSAESSTPLTPLQQYDIGQLKLTGIVQGVEPPRAMVEDASGLGFTIYPGTPIGTNGGVVTAIRPRQVVVEEWYTDVIGERHRREMTLNLPADKNVDGNVDKTGDKAEPRS